jgi:hypothetical protein
METILGLSACHNVISQQSFISAFEASHTHGPNQLPTYHRRHNSIGEEQRPQTSASWSNTPEERKTFDTAEPYLYRKFEGGGGTNGTGFPGTVLPGTATLPCSRAMQPEDTRGHSPPASQTSFMKTAFEAGSSRSPSHMRRASIGSIKEETTGVFPHINTTSVPWLIHVCSDVPQSFLDRRPKTPPSPDGSQPAVRDTHTLSATPNFYCPSGAFQGWKQVKLAGKRQNKSSSDLKRLTSLRNEWVWDSTNDPKTPKMDTPLSAFRKVGMEDMPYEILGNYKSDDAALKSFLLIALSDMILSYLMQDLSPNSYGPRNRDLIACLLTSRLLHAATLSVLYKHVTIPFSITFSKMLNHISDYPVLGTLVRRLDFSHYTSVGFGRTRRDSWEIQNVTPKTMLQCLELCTNLKEFQVHEHIDDELDEEVVKKLFSMPSIHAMDFCACSSRRFVGGFTATMMANELLPASLSNLKRLGLHACTTLQAPVFEALLPRLTCLTHLDVGMTLITDEALLSIPQSARITHLDLGKCTRLTGPKVVEFLTNHEAVRHSLVFLNIMTDISRYMLLSDEDIEKLLPRLPRTMKSLNIGGAQISRKHVPLLLPLTKHLEELGLNNADLTVAHLNSLFVPSPPADYADSDISEEELNWEPCSLRYLDLTGVPSLNQSTLFSPGCVLASPHSYPLEVIELSDPIIQQLKIRANTVKRIGWTVKELGRRGWFVRLPTSDKNDDGRRNWKMGARWWGMRKVPVAVQEVGGMYGHYMFKR